jgi:hypothetical protein
MKLLMLGGSHRLSQNGKRMSGNVKTRGGPLGHPQKRTSCNAAGGTPKKVMDAAHFDTSLTALFAIEPRQVTLEMSTWEQFGRAKISSDSVGVERMSGRCFWPYIQDPPRSA